MTDIATIRAALDQTHAWLRELCDRVEQDEAWKREANIEWDAKDVRFRELERENIALRRERAAFVTWLEDHAEYVSSKNTGGAQ